jgi:hypothetical protein
MLIGGWCTKKSEVGGGEREGFSRENIEEVCCHTEGSNPKGGWYTCVKEQGANDIVNGTNDAFSFAVLSGSVWTRHAKKNSVRCKKGSSTKIVKFTSIVVLESLNGNTKLGVDIGEEIRQGGKGVGLKA